MKKILILVVLLMNLMYGSDDFEIYASVSKEEIKLKWITDSYSSQNIYNIYRTDKNGQKLIATTKTIAYDLLVKSDKYTKEDFAFFYPYKDLKTLNDDMLENKEQEMRSGFRILKILKENFFAKDIGQYIVDKDIKPDTKYTYKIDMLRDGSVIKTKSITLKSSIKYLQSGIFFVNAKSTISGVHLKWGTGNRYGFYNVYRKLNKNEKFKKLNVETLYISPEYSQKAKKFYEDRVLEVGQKAYYRITKVDMFGVEGVASYEVSGKKLKVKNTPIVRNIFIKNRDTKVVIRWQSIPNILGYNIYRSKNNKNDFKRLNIGNKKKEVYFDTSFSTNQDYYYYVTSLSKDGESTPSVKSLSYTRDVTPPNLPKELSFDVKKGVVNLNWKAINDSDLLGYRVYISMDKNAQKWSKITKKEITKNMFSHKRAKTLSRHFYFYKVTSVDKSFNESASSNIVKVKLPDVIAPLQPIITKYVSYPSKIKLEWAKTLVYDFNYYNIYRKDGEKLNEKPLKKNIFTDLKPKDGVNEYIITAVDMSGNESVKEKSVKVNLQDIKPVIIENFKLTKADKGVKISFTCSDTDYNGFEVYRSEGNDRKYYNISSFQKSKSFIDKNVAKGRVYFYMIKAYDKVGNIKESSTLSIKY